LNGYLNNHSGIGCWRHYSAALQRNEVEDSLQNGSYIVNSTSEEHQTVQTILKLLIVLQSHLSLYGSDNDNVVLTTSRLFAALGQFFSIHETLPLLVARHGFLFEKVFVDRKSGHFEKFAYQMFQHGIAALNIEKGVTPGSLQTFLQLISRKPFATWDEGGIEVSLRARDVTQIGVRETVDSDFLLNEQVTDDEKDLIVGGTSRLWDVFVQTLLQGLDEEIKTYPAGQEMTPQALAEVTNRNLDGSDTSSQMTFARDASRFLPTLKHENIIPYRNDAVKRLIAFVEKLTPALRRMFLNNTFNLNNTPELTEQFLSGLSDDVILDALQDSADSDNYIPPIVVELLGKLAKNRDMDIGKQLPEDGDPQDDQNRLKTLFKPDDFKKYVPEDYQQTLLQILQSDSLPAGTTENVARLKQTLEQDMLDDQLGAVLFEILRQSLDPKNSTGFSLYLIDTFDHYLEAGSFDKITQLCRKYLEAQDRAEPLPEISDYLSSDRFTTGILDAVMSQATTGHDEILELIDTIREPFIVPLLNRLPLEKDRTLHKLYLNCLKKIGEPVVALAVERLTDEEWLVSKNMLHLLREIGDQSVLPEIRGCLRHPHPKVVQEALMTCLVFKDRAVDEEIIKLLDAEKDTGLLRTIMLAGMSDSDRVVDKLLDLLRTSTLLDYQLDIRKAVVRSLAVSTPKRAIPVFADILGSRSLMHSQEHKMFKMEILTALGKYPATEVMTLIDGQTNSKVPEIARQATIMRERLAGKGTP
jgi:hypothetical protein